MLKQTFPDTHFIRKTHPLDATLHPHYTTPCMCRMCTYTRIECSAVHRRIAATADGRKSLGDCERFLAPDQGPEYIILLKTTRPCPGYTPRSGVLNYAVYTLEKRGENDAFPTHAKIVDCSGFCCGIYIFYGIFEMVSVRI